VHTSEQKQHVKKPRKDSENRRASKGQNMGSRKYSKQNESDNYKIPNTNKNMKRSPSYKNSILEDKQTNNKSVHMFNNSKTSNTRNNNENVNSKTQSKTFSSHAHHKSSNDIENTKNIVGNAYNPKLIEMTKKRHRKDMKSGDHIKHNNFKFMNVNWLNQNIPSITPPFYANQQANSSMNTTNLMMFQQMNKMGLHTNQQDMSAMLAQNQLGNNQSLLIYDQQTNSIIPMNQAFGNQMNNMINKNPTFTPGSAINKSGIEDTPSPIVINTGQKNRHEDGLREQLSNIPFYMQDANIKLDKSANKNQISGSKRGSIYDNTEIPQLKLDMDQYDNESNIIKPSGESTAKDTYLNSESIKMNAKNIYNHGVKDSLNNRISSGIHDIEISKLKASDFDLNNRESE
jgi:hypothetical protein